MRYDKYLLKKIAAEVGFTLSAVNKHIKMFAGTYEDFAPEEYRSLWTDV